MEHYPSSLGLWHSGRFFVPRDGRILRPLSPVQYLCHFRLKSARFDPSGIIAISRGLSAATSPERSPTKSTHPGRDARGHGAFFRSAFYHPFRVRRFNAVDSGGVASLNHRLMAVIPPGSIRSLPICDHLRPFATIGGYWRILADIGGKPPRATDQSLGRSLTLPPASRVRNGSRRD